jgi:hypothetical protein
MAAEDYIPTWPDDEMDNFGGDPCYDVFDSIEAETKKAILFKNDKGLFWIPKSILSINLDEVIYPSWFDIEYK